jgi:hypothetical protein
MKSEQGANMSMGSDPTLRRDLIRLVRIEYDALAACRAARNHTRREADLVRIDELEQVHQRHIRCLVPAVWLVGGRAPRAGDWRQLVTQGRVLTASVFGPDSLLLALKDNEIDVAQAYRRVLQREDLNDGIRARLDAHAASASRQCLWLREQAERETD